MSVLLLTMGPQLGITADIPVVAVGGAGVIRFRAIGATGPVKWTLVDSNLPVEWDSALNPDGDDVTLTTADAETPGAFRVTVLTVDSARIPVVRSFDVRVMALPLTISGAFPVWTEGVAVTGSLTISGGIPPYSGLTITSGALPSGVSLSIVGSQIVPSGSPTVAGPWSATVQISDSLSTPASNVASGDISVPTDPYWEHVVSLLHFDGPDGSTTFTDQTGKVWTPSGNAQIDTAHSKFGGASGLFDGSGDYISSASSADFDFGSGDFTIEFWARPAASITATQIVLAKAAGEGTRSFVFGFANGNTVYFGYTTNGTNFTDVVSSTSAVSASTFNHVAVVRSGASILIFANGSQVKSESIGGSIFTASTSQTIGGRPADSQYFNGHIDDLRVTKGVARYTANFTPPDIAFPDQ